MPTSKHHELLNDLEKMQHSSAYALRWDVLRKAELLIASQEEELAKIATVNELLAVSNERLRNANAELLEALEAMTECDEGSMSEQRALGKAYDLIAKHKGT